MVNLGGVCAGNSPIWETGRKPQIEGIEKGKNGKRKNYLLRASDVDEAYHQTKRRGERSRAVKLFEKRAAAPPA